MRDELKALFEDNKVRTIYGTIEQRIDSRTYVILDDKESLIRVKSTQNWSLKSRVLVQNGVIIGPGKIPEGFVVYRV